MTAGHGAVRWSLGRRLLVQLLAVFAVLAVLLYLSVRIIAEEAASATQDNTLGASVAAIIEQTSLQDNAITVDIPYAALAMLGASGEDRVFYRIALAGGGTLTGYDDLPQPPRLPPPGEQVAWTADYRGDPVRVVAASRAFYGAGARQTVIVSVAQTREAYQAITDRIAVSAAAVGGGFLLLAGGLSWLMVRSSLRPLKVIEGMLRSRGPRDLAPLDADAPREVEPMISALNGFLNRLRITLGTTEDFIAEAAHRIRTPLAGVRAQAEVAMRQARQDATRDAFRRILRAVDQTARSTSQLLDHAMVSYRTDRWEPQEIDLVSLMADAQRECATTADLRDIDVVFTPPDAPVLGSGDRILLLEALRNLIDNAVKYSPGETTVRLSLEADGEKVRLVVEDEGRGIAAADMDRVRERFARGAGADDVVGSGLGLTIVEQVATAHGGALEIGPRKHRGLRAAIVLPRLRGGPA